MIDKLHKIKEYKLETFHLAVSIADRYLEALSRQETTPKVDFVALATISLLIAAKLEQPISPSFSKMIDLL